ncbi:hypothetical protein FA95DRAFT_1610837 [Auriscalpium vulgare]|uniref:Uncharacterized protein n=1 Tax=Auriscalpium vulgare TaxID=40419 RepID=A0ACB8RCF2_9AGAM|nr:hypothetical protein FA95DRAFT_1610837 [Auriscalpium vulgare]
MQKEHDFALAAARVAAAATDQGSSTGVVRRPASPSASEPASKRTRQHTPDFSSNMILEDAPAPPSPPRLQIEEEEEEDLYEGLPLYVGQPLLEDARRTSVPPSPPRRRIEENEEDNPCGGLPLNVVQPLPGDARTQASPSPPRPHVEDDDDEDLYGELARPDRASPVPLRASPSIALPLDDIEEDHAEHVNGDAHDNHPRGPPRYEARDAVPDDIPGGPGEPEVMVAHLGDLKNALAFVQGLRDAMLEGSGLSPDVVERLRNPITSPADVADPDLGLALDFFLASTTGSEANYTEMRTGYHRRHPDEPEIMSLYQIKQKVCELSGVSPILTDMCPNTCLAYTGPFCDRESCSYCGISRWHPSKGHGVPARQFLTIPIGPQLQALYRSAESAKNMRHRKERTEEILRELRREDSPGIQVYDDIYHGSDYLAAVDRGDIGPEDIVLMYSIDGAQLYQSKQSDCWISIWVILNLAPELRYKKKHVLPSSFIGGPNKPKHADSYMYVSLHHLAALMKDGLAIWDALVDQVITRNLFFALGTADGPGLCYLNGKVPHHGAKGCRTHCGVKGRHKKDAPHYYIPLLLPDNYTEENCDHGDYDVYNLPVPSANEYMEDLKKLLAARTEAQFKRLRRETGITKPSLFSGLPSNQRLAIPGCFPIDLLHLVALNITELLISLWRGTILCEKPDSKTLWDWMVLVGDTWKKHGAFVASLRCYLPGSFDRPPRNPAEKISSGYKAWEFLMYIFAMGPSVFRGILPKPYYISFCKLVRAVRLLHQRSIAALALAEAHIFVLEFTEEFELMYYQRKATRIHFCRQSIHGLSHVAPGTVLNGPACYYEQWVLERTIGNLGEEIKQPSMPFANLAQRGLRRCQVNALKAMIPDLDPDQPRVPRGAADLGNGYVLLRARDEHPWTLEGAAARVLRDYTTSQSVNGELPADWSPRVYRWARLRLPNGQIARALWKEGQRVQDAIRRARNVLVGHEGTQRIAEVQFYFRDTNNEAVALVSLFSHPDQELLQETSKTLAVCDYNGEESFTIVKVTAIRSVVAMHPMWDKTEFRDNQFSLCEKMGLEVAELGGAADVDEDDE